jgi:hypothetical protein
MYVETDFLMGLAKQDDWLQDAALDAQVGKADATGSYGNQRFP